MVPSAFDIMVIATILVRGRQQLGKFLNQKIAIIINRRPFNNGTLALPVEMPRHDVGMVLKDRENNLIPLAQHHATIRLRHQINRIRGVAGEDDLIFGWSIEEFANGTHGASSKACVAAFERK